jgi:hypothetical protein
MQYVGLVNTLFPSHCLQFLTVFLLWRYCSRWFHPTLLQNIRLQRTFMQLWTWTTSREILLFLWNRWFTTLFTRAEHWSISWASRIQSTPSL